MRPPCIRNLERFKKKGCPQSGWNGSEGCPAWKEMIIATRDNPLKKETRKQCIDQWAHDFAWAALGLAEGNQAAVEKFRNQMTTENGPRPDPAIIQLVDLVVNGPKGLIPQ